jgi:hypothetical protein
MAETLGSTQVIGGISVEIGANLAPLRAGVAEAKAFAAATERQVKIGLPMVIASGAEAKLRSDVSRVAAAIGAGTTIRVPLMLDFSRVAGQIALLRGTVSGLSMSIGGGGGGRGGGGRGGTANGGDFFEGEVVSSRWAGQQMLAGPGSVGAGAAAAGGGGGSGGGDWRAEWRAKVSAMHDDIFGAGFVRGGVGGGGGGVAGGASAIGGGSWVTRGRAMLRGSPFARMFMAGAAVREIVGLGNAIGAGRMAQEIGDPDMQQQFADQYESGLNSTSFGLRQLFRTSIPNALGYTTAAQRDQVEGNRIRGEAARRDAQTQRIAARADLSQQIITSDAAQRTGFAGQAQLNLDTFDKTNGSNTAVSRQARAALVSQVSQGMGFDRLQASASQSAVSSMGFSIAAMNAGLAGDSRGAIIQSGLAQRDQIAGQGAASLVGVSDPNKRQQIIKQTTAQLQVADAQQAVQLEQLRRDKAIDADTAIASKHEATLRINKQNYKADLDAFDAATKAKIDSINDLDGKQNESTRRAAQRQVLVAQQREQIKGANTLMAIGGQAALASLRNRGDEADLKSLRRIEPSSA